FAVCIRVHWRRQKRRVRIPVFIATSWSRGTNVGWNTLGSYGNPLTSQVVIPISREFELPKRCINTHTYLMRLMKDMYVASYSLPRTRLLPNVSRLLGRVLGR